MKKDELSESMQKAVKKFADHYDGPEFPVSKFIDELAEEFDVDAEELLALCMPGGL